MKLPAAILFGVFFVSAADCLADDNYGAIAFDSATYSYGVSWDNPSQPAAEQTALRQCQTKGSDCRIVVRFVNGCGAYATGPGGTYGYGWGATRQQAEQAAEFYCDRQANGMCRPRVWGCDSTVAAEPKYPVHETTDPRYSADPSAAARNREYAKQAMTWGGQQEYDRICQNSPGGCQ